MGKEGFIYLHRKLEEWEWYDDANTFRLFIHCLLEANFIEKNWRGIKINRAQFITSQPKLAQELKLSVQQIRTALNKLKSTGEITVYTTADYSVITVKNYDIYQNNNSLNNSLITDKQQANNSLITTTNNDNNDNNDNNEKKYINNNNNKEIFSNFEKPTKKEIEDYAHNQLGKRINNIDEFISWYDAQGWEDKNGFPINWKQKVQSWIRRNPTFNKVEKNVKKEEVIDYNDFSTYRPY